MFWTNRMFVNNYIRETFTDGITHTVNLPINTTTSCKNMCGPPNRCSITGTECLSDIDCYGCQPNTSPDLSNTFLNKNKQISGYTQGVDEWTKKNKAMKTVYDKRFKVPPKTVFLSSYPPRPSVTGEYMDSGPFASNATLVSKEVFKP